MDTVDERIRKEMLATRAEQFRPGIYRHTRSGDIYQALFLAFDHERRDQVVVYVSMSTGSVNVRPLFRKGEDSWCDVITDHPYVERFQRFPDGKQPK